MTTLAPAPAVVRLVAHGSIGAVTTANVFHVKGSTGSSWSQPDLDTLVTNVRAAYVSQFLPLVTSSFTLGAMDAIDLTSDVGLTSVVGTSNVGGKAGTSLPSNVAQCITWRTPAHFRGGHCRTYLPPPSFNEVTTPNTWLAAHVTALLAAAAAFRLAVNTAIGAITPTLVMLSRTRNKAPISGGPVAYAVTQGLVDTRVDSQRRRLGKDR